MESRRSLADSPPFIRLVQQVNLNSVFLPLVITNSISVLAQAKLKLRIWGNGGFGFPHIQTCVQSMSSGLAFSD